MNDHFEATVRRMAQDLPYPPTPEIRLVAGAKRMPGPRTAPRLLRAAAVIVLLVLVTGMAVPGIRAAVLEFLRFGAVTIYLDGSDAQGEPLRLDQISGETTLQAAQQETSFVLMVPPDDPPDRVFLQDEDAVILVWTDGAEIERALYQSTNYYWGVIKMADSIEFTQIGDLPAYWMTVQHPVHYLRDGEVYAAMTHFVSGNVLGWEQNDITYRLETSDSLDVARSFAQSLVPYGK